MHKQEHFKNRVKGKAAVLKELKEKEAEKNLHKQQALARKMAKEFEKSRSKKKGTHIWFANKLIGRCRCCNRLSRE